MKLSCIAIGFLSMVFLPEVRCTASRRPLAVLKNSKATFSLNVDAKSFTSEKNPPVIRGGAAAKKSTTSTTPIASQLIGLLLWACPVWFYVKGYPLTQEFVKVLKEMVEGKTPYLEQWEAIVKIGGVPGVLSHIQWGSPSVALYLVATLCFFPWQSFVGSSAVAPGKAGSLFTIPAGLLLARSLLGAFQVIGALFSHPDSQGTALVIATLLIVLTTLPFLQLISWQIEYSLRTLREKPGEAVLPGWYMTLVSKTNFLRFLVGPLKKMFSWSVLPKGYSASGVAAVQSIADADYYSNSNADELDAEGLSSIITGLTVQVMYGSLAVIPMWAVLTNFGLFAVESTPATRCVWSRLWLKLHPSNWNPADIGISGMLGPYWLLSFGWLLWGVAIKWLFG